MAKFKQRKDGYRSFGGNLRVLAKENTFLYRVEVWLLNNKRTRNGWRYEKLAEHKDLFAETPILIAYVNNGAKIGDGHNFVMRRDKNGSEYASFVDGTAERIVGWFKDAGSIRIEQKDGVDWIVGEGYIWAWYAAELVEMLEEKGASGMDVSIETLVYDDNVENEDGGETYHKYDILGTTILGRGVTPAVAGANIRALSENDNLNEYKLRVAAFMEKQETEKKGVKKPMSKSMKAKMQALFGEHKVLSVDGKNVCLLSADGLSTYTFDEEAEVDANKILPYQQLATISVNGVDMTVDIADIIDDYAAKATLAEQKMANAIEQLNSANEEIQSMREREQKRRMSAVENSVKNLWDELNAIMGGEADEEIVNTIVNNAAEYAEMEADGEWVGEQRALDDLMAKRTAKVLEQKRKEQREQVLSYESLGEKPSVGDLLDCFD